MVPGSYFISSPYTGQKEKYRRGFWKIRPLAWCRCSPHLPEQPFRAWPSGSLLDFFLGEASVDSSLFRQSRAAACQRSKKWCHSIRENFIARIPHEFSRAPCCQPLPSEETAARRVGCNDVSGTHVYNIAMLCCTVKFIPDEDAAAWLSDFIPDSDNFDWDEGNMFKNFKHGMSPGEVESLFWQRTFLFAGKIVEPLHNEWRGLILGRTNNGQLVSLIHSPG